MSESTTPPAIDKSTWGEGPWQTDPDRLEWTHAGLPCLARRNERHGNWCGYAAVPPGHPLHGKSYHDVELELEAHGGLTYADRCSGEICHVPAPGESDEVWWFGFDCAHFRDFLPGMHARLRSYGAPFSDVPYDHAAAYVSPDSMLGMYRTLAYVQVETNHLADQLAEYARPAPAVREDVAAPIVSTRVDVSDVSDVCGARNYLQLEEWGVGGVCTLAPNHTGWHHTAAGQLHDVSWATGASGF